MIGAFLLLLSNFVFSQLCEVNFGAIILVMESPSQRNSSDAFCNFLIFFPSTVPFEGLFWKKNDLCWIHCKFVLMVDLT